MKAKFVYESLNEGCGCGGKKRPRPTIVPTQRPASQPQRPPIIRRPPPKQLHEKFSQTGDPIEDMDIGMKKIWKSIAKDFLDNMYGDMGRIGQIYFGNKNYEGLAYVLYGFFKRIHRDGDNPQDAFYKSCENENFYGRREDIVRERKTIAKVIKKYFDIDINPNDPRLFRD